MQETLTILQELGPFKNDAANRVFEEWIKLREAQGWTREAALHGTYDREGSRVDRNES